MTAFYSRKTFPWWLCLRLTVVTITAAAETDLKKLGSANNGFALEMYKQISDADGDGGNVFFSPISVTTALAMTYTGARGTTAQQMEQVLNFDDIGSASDVHAAFRQLLNVFNEPEKNYTLSLANRLFGASGYDFLQDFMDLTDTYYDAPMTSLDFVLEPDISREHINEWVENKTEGKIQDILEQGTIIPSTVLVLVNAIYFKGKWAVPFDPEHTVIGDFHISEGSTVKTDMMTMSDTEFLYGESADLNAKILRLPYGGEEVSMFILLPNSVTGLSSVEEKLSLDGLKFCP